MVTEESRFKNARKIYNINGAQSVKEVSKATGITGSLIDDLETSTSKRDVGYSKIKALAEYYGVSVDYLMGLTDCPKPYLTISEYTGLSEKAINGIIRMNKETGGILNRFFEELAK